MSTLTRRNLLGAAAALPLAPMAHAAAPMLGADFARHHRFTIGSFEVTTLLVGTNLSENPHSFFGTNVSDEEFNAVSADNFIPADTVQFFFTPTVVNTGPELVLFDTGLNGERTTATLETAGYTADMIDRVVITHMHGDHIGGLMTNGTPTFPNASYVTGSAEFDYWASADNNGFENNVRPLADQFTFIDEGAEILSGVTAVRAEGHTPGHLTYRIDSDGEALLLLADLANHAVWSLAYPDWEVRFDIDKAAAAASRRRVLGMAAADRIPVIGYHLPFPAIGYVDNRGDGFRYVPAGGQFMD